jgi:uncharacterized protein YbjT (DUF2867 family)
MSRQMSVLVTGATGQQGGAVARALLAEGFHVRALTRKPDGPSARQLAVQGAEIVVGDLNSPQTIRAAARGADAMFLMGNFYEAGEAGEIQQGIAAAEAAKAAGVGHLIYSSVASADRATGIPHFESKYRVEQHICSLGLNHTILAPVAFMENLIAPWAIGTLRNGVLATALPPERRNQFIAVDDIGAFAVAILRRGSRAFGRRFEIAGESLSGSEQAQVLAHETERPVRYEEIPIDILRRQDPDTASMFEWINRAGYDVDIAALRRTFPEVAWTGFRDWSRRVARPVLDASSAAEVLPA